jgi:hypothetical protein
MGISRRLGDALALTDSQLCLVACRGVFALSLHFRHDLLRRFCAASARLPVGLNVERKTIMDAACVGIGMAFFLAAWWLVGALGRLGGGVTT